jgi:hypothetical protein
MGIIMHRKTQSDIELSAVEEFRDQTLRFLNESAIDELQTEGLNTYQLRLRLREAIHHLDSLSTHLKLYKHDVDA